MTKFLFLTLFSMCVMVKVAYADNFSSYLSDFRNVEMNFLQDNPDGTTAEGSIFFISPKKFRLEYLYPSPIVLILNNKVVTYHDYDLEETSHKILSKDNRVIKLLNEFHKILHEKSKHNGKTITFTDVYEDNVVTLIFNAKPVSLEKMLIKNSSGYETKVKFFNIRYNVNFAKNLLTEF